MKTRTFFSDLVLVVLLITTVNRVSASPVSPQVAGGGVSKPGADTSLTQGPKIHFPEMEYSFGTVKSGEKVRYDFEVANLGNQTLEITEVRPSCGCTTAGTWTRSIAPKGTGIIPIQLDTGRFKGNLTKTIHVKSNDPKQKQVTLKIKGTIWEPVLISSRTVVFPSSADPSVSASKSIKIINQVDQPFEITNLQVHAKTFSAKLEPVVEGKEYDLVITTVPPLKEGLNRATITMRTSNLEVPSISINTFASVLPAVQVIPQKIVLPKAKLETQVKRYVTVINRREGDFVVSDLETTVEGVNVSATEVQKGKRVTISLVFPKGFEMPQSGTLSLMGKTNRPELPSFEIPVSYVQGR